MWAIVLLLLFAVTTSTLPTLKTDQENNITNEKLYEPEHVRLRRNAPINLPVIIGNSVDTVNKLWANIAKGASDSKISLTINNYSKWMMTHVSTNCIDGLIGSIPNVVFPGVEEKSLAYQPDAGYEKSTKGIVVWEISFDTNTTSAYCAVFWHVPTVFFSRCPNHIGIKCSRNKFDPPPDVKDYAAYTGSHTNKKITSLISCHDNLFCLRATLPNDNKPTAYISLMPKKLENWATYTISKQANLNQNHIDAMIKSDHYTPIQIDDKCEPTLDAIYVIVFSILGLLLLSSILYCSLHWDAVKERYHHFKCCEYTSVFNSKKLLPVHRSDQRISIVQKNSTF